MIDKSNPTLELIAVAYKNEDEEAYWQVIQEIHQRGSEVEFSIACDLARSSDPVNREIGADILGQVGWVDGSFQDESIPILIGLLQDPCDDVIASAAFSLGHRQAPLAISGLIKLVAHDNARVREGVVSGLNGLDSSAAISALVTLSDDVDSTVRSWATFGIGSLSEVDNQMVRKALLDRAEDKDPETRGEALIGLANRRVPDVQGYLLSELSGEFNGNWALEAARTMADPVYCSALCDLKRRETGVIEDRFIRDIDDAIASCCGGQVSAPFKEIE